tara:strand:- start:8507 stop:8893 length:387 start_codon:yes stop_codon:yes gene_type:complete
MKLHHIGYVVDNFESYFDFFPKLQVNKKIIDPVQNAEIILCNNGDSSTYVELIKPIDEKSFTWNFLQKGGGLHHICYDSLKLIEIEEVIKKYKMLKIRGPMYAKLFDKEVIFVITKTKDIVEFIVCEK